MIRRLRRKVIAINMLLVTAVLAIVLFGIYFAARHIIVQNSDSRLESAILQEASSYRQNDMPVLVVDLLPSGTVRILDNSTYIISDEEALLTVLNDCLEQADDSGTLSGHDLRYLRAVGFLSIRIALVDCSEAQATLHSLLLTLMLVGLGALPILFVCACVLSRLATRPAADAWTAQQRFLSDASHELKTPLTVILASAELLRSGDADISRNVDNISAEGRRMKHLVEEMLTLSRVENLPKDTCVRLDWSDLCEQAVITFEPLAFESGHLLCDEIAPDISLTGSAEQLSRLVEILLDNAIKYAAPDSPIRLTLQRDGKWSRLTVENKGDPIPPEKLPHLFERFYRADSARTDTDGFGLGLSIAQSIAHYHKGSLTCESDQLSTRFILTLPL